MLDPNGEQVGKVKDVVIQNRSGRRSPKVKGLVVELFAHRRIFFPMERVHSIDPNQVIVSGLVNTRRFVSREREMLVAAELFDRTVRREGANGAETIFDIAIQRTRSREWSLAEVALREVARRPFQRPHVTIVDWSEVPEFIEAPAPRDAEQQVMRLSELKAADVARELHDMDPMLRASVVQAMDDDRLAEALEELPEDEQVDVIAAMDTERAADVLGEMDPDDAADLIAELEPGLAETLLQRMEPEDAQDVRTLLTYDASTAGGLMNPEPVILGVDATVADALAQLRQVEVTPAIDRKSVV